MVRLLVSKVAARSSARCLPLPCNSSTMAKRRSVRFICWKSSLPTQEEIDCHSHANTNHEDPHPTLLDAPRVIRSTKAAYNSAYHHQNRLRPHHCASDNKSYHGNTVDATL